VAAVNWPCTVMMPMCLAENPTRLCAGPRATRHPLRPSPVRDSSFRIAALLLSAAERSDPDCCTSALAAAPASSPSRPALRAWPPRQPELAVPPRWSLAVALASSLSACARAWPPLAELAVPACASACQSRL